MKRTLSAILSIIMLLGTLFTAIGCSDPSNNQDPATTTAAAVGSNADEVTTDNLYDDKGYLKDSLDPSLNFGGETVNIFAWEHTLPEFEVEEQSGNIVEDAIYTRNANTESRLGVKLAFTITKGNSGAFKEFCQEVSNSISVNDGEYFRDKPEPQYDLKDKVANAER